MSKVYVKFPKSGLGNLMLVWAKAKLFAELNGLSFTAAPWWGFRLGAWKRNERKKRLYIGYFKENSFAERLLINLYALTATIIKDPEVKKLEKEEKNANRLFVFNKISTSDDIFFDIRQHRDFIRDEIYKILTPALLQQLHRYPTPAIAIHIRRGDFKIANPVTPLSFFIDCITAVRSVVGEDLPVTIFTDAHPDEVKEVLLLPHTKIAEDKPDILDILLMSKSKVMVLSKSSTFSYWGAFLSDAIVLRPFDDWQKQIRGEGLNKTGDEILWKEKDPECVQQLSRSILSLQSTLQKNN